MNWLDLLIVGILAWFTFRAFTNGLIREVVSLLGLIAGVVLAGTFYDDLSANLEFVIEDATTRRLIAYGAIFIGTTVAGMVIAAVLHETNLAETKGSGIRVMRQLMNEVGLTPPASSLSGSSGDPESRARSPSASRRSSPGHPREFHQAPATRSRM